MSETATKKVELNLAELEQRFGGQDPPMKCELCEDGLMVLVGTQTTSAGPGGVVETSIVYGCVKALEMARVLSPMSAEAFAAREHFVRSQVSIPATKIGDSEVMELIRRHRTAVDALRSIRDPKRSGREIDNARMMAEATLEQVL